MQTTQNIEEKAIVETKAAELTVEEADHVSGGGQLQVINYGTDGNKSLGLMNGAMNWTHSPRSQTTASPESPAAPFPATVKGLPARHERLDAARFSMAYTFLIGLRATLRMSSVVEPTR
jgi:hypothetical protein